VDVSYEQATLYLRAGRETTSPTTYLTQCYNRHSNGTNRQLIGTPEATRL
jgi:hypothetical protein